MVKAKITRTDTRVTEVVIKGHSGYAKYGKDIVCSAISSIVQTALLGVIDVSNSKVDYVVGEEGYLKFSVPEPTSEVESIQQEAILRTMILGLRDLEKGYKPYLELEE